MRDSASRERFKAELEYIAEQPGAIVFRRKGANDMGTKKTKPKPPPKPKKGKGY